MAIQILLDYEIIDRPAYNEIMYGTTDEQKINFIRLGFSLGVLNKIETDEKLGNLSINGNNQIIASIVFQQYKKELDDFTRYEIERIL